MKDGTDTASRSLTVREKKKTGRPTMKHCRNGQKARAFPQNQEELSSPLDLFCYDSGMIMWLQDHDHVVSDAERGGDAIMNPVAAIGKRRSRWAWPARRPRPIPAEHGPPAAQNAINESLARVSRGLGERSRASRESAFVASARRSQVGDCAASR